MQFGITSVDKVRAVTPSDTVDLPDGLPYCLYVGSTAGGTDVTFIDNTGTTVLMSGVVAGTSYPFRPKRIKATGTTATSMLVGYNEG